MADEMIKEDRKCSTAQAPDAGSSKRATSKSFRSFFRRKKKPPARMRDHCLSVDETEYQPRHHAGHYHTVSGTGSLGHVIHDQFSRRHLRRAHAHARCTPDSGGDEDDDDRPDMTSSRRLPGYFRWRYRSAPETGDDDTAAESRSSSSGGNGGLGGSRVRHWIYSIRQRSRSGDAAPPAAASGVHHDLPRSLLSLIHI